MSEHIRSRVSPNEWQLPYDIVACYDMVALCSWDGLLFPHISTRVPGPENQFLVDPYGMMFEEVSASSLVYVDMDGTNIMDSVFDANPVSFSVHRTVHEESGNAMCVLQLKNNEGSVACV